MLEMLQSVRLQKNENPQEYFGTRITTRNLYDSIVGIGNVQIKLYKIEAQREYPITWAQAAKNSGGEGFLTAFVLLSSLLYYMRRDETDIFADRNEGKVLVMDNPFAQTNAAHLLKPLMDMADKMNTQLICFSGLGGSSILKEHLNQWIPESFDEILDFLEKCRPQVKKRISCERERAACFAALFTRCGMHGAKPKSLAQ